MAALSKTPSHEALNISLVLTDGPLGDLVDLGFIHPDLSIFEYNLLGGGRGNHDSSLHVVAMALQVKLPFLHVGVVDNFGVLVPLKIRLDRLEILGGLIHLRKHGVQFSIGCATRARRVGLLSKAAKRKQNNQHYRNALHETCLEL